MSRSLATTAFIDCQFEDSIFRFRVKSTLRLQILAALLPCMPKRLDELLRGNKSVDDHVVNTIVTHMASI